MNLLCNDTPERNMTDKELLEAAARAAGFEVEPHPNNKSCRDLMFIYKRSNWNPLTDDGDALRLAVKLNMNISVSETECLVTRGHSISECIQAFDGSATRRAIVRAAAAIGSRHNAMYTAKPAL